MKLTASNFAYMLYCASIALAAPTVKRQSGTTYDGGSTANDVQNGVCAPVTLIFARGSTETGNMGSSVGPALAQELISELGNDGVAIQGVDYSATIESNLSMGQDGGPELAKLAQQALQNCPNTKIAIAGYSQGATVCHYAVAQGGLSASSVSSATLYGDPENGSAVGDLSAARTKEFCASGDGVCEGGGFAISAAHLSYATSQDIPEGAQFIVQNAGSTTTGTSPPSGSGSSTPSSPPSPSIPSIPSVPAPSSSSTPNDPFGGLFGFGGGDNSGLDGLTGLGGDGIDFGNLGGSTSGSGILSGIFKRFF